jgi:hypothetical protein
MSGSRMTRSRAATHAPLRDPRQQSAEAVILLAEGAPDETP